jgi:ATP-dependent 26S proteasome regulatory subunit
MADKQHNCTEIGTFAIRKYRTSTRKQNFTKATKALKMYPSKLKP